jgi:hypothetical protein
VRAGLQECTGLQSLKPGIQKPESRASVARVAVAKSAGAFRRPQDGKSLVTDDRTACVSLTMLELPVSVTIKCVALGKGATL